MSLLSRYLSYVFISKPTSKIIYYKALILPLLVANCEHKSRDKFWKINLKKQKCPQKRAFLR